MKKAVAGYFNDPKGTGEPAGNHDVGHRRERAPRVADENQQKLQELKEKLEKEIEARKELEKLSKQIEITITPEGLRIELLEDKNGTFYQSGSAQLSPSGQELLALLAAELKTLPNQLLIEGHTDAAQYSTRRELQQLGALGRPRQLGAAAAAADGVRAGPGDAGARLCRPDAAREEQSVRPVEPADHDSGEEPGRCAAAATVARAGGERGSRIRSGRCERQRQAASAAPKRRAAASSPPAAKPATGTPATKPALPSK